MASESRLISSKVVSAIHPDLWYVCVCVCFFFFGSSIPRPSLISLPPFYFFFSLFFHFSLSTMVSFLSCVSGGRWINKRANAKCGLHDRCTMECWRRTNAINVRGIVGPEVDRLKYSWKNFGSNFCCFLW